MEDERRPLTAAIQGERGAFSHEGALLACGRDTEVRPQPTFDALFAAVESGAADRGIVPVENSLAGSVHDNYDRLRASALHVVGEVQVRVRLCLIGRKGASLASIRRAASHPVALAQCRRFFAEHPEIEPVAAYDTAGSVKDLGRGDGPVSQGAIASRLAAELYGGSVLREGIEDDPRNFTRMLVVAREAHVAPDAGRTSLVLTLQNVPGALHRALGCFAGRGLDLARIESRPLHGRPWEYAFYLDVLGAPGPALAAALDDLGAMAGEMRVLGSYACAPEAVP